MNKRKTIDVKGDKNINRTHAFMKKKALQNNVLQKIVEEINKPSPVKNEDSRKEQNNSE